jgi:hypothetical protein
VKQGRAGYRLRKFVQGRAGQGTQKIHRAGQVAGCRKLRRAGYRLSKLLNLQTSNCVYSGLWLPLTMPSEKMPSYVDDEVREQIYAGKCSKQIFGNVSLI